MSQMHTYDVVIMIGAGIGVLVFWFALCRPARRREAEKGIRWGVPPVLRDCCERELDLKRTELQRLLTQVRTQQRIQQGAQQGPEVAPVMHPKVTMELPTRVSQSAPIPVGPDALMPAYRGRASLSVLGPAGELFLHLEQPITDRQGRQYLDVATSAIIPPDARGFVEQAIQEDRWLLISSIPANAYEARLRVTVEEADGRLVPLREWVLEQAVAWQPLSTARQPEPKQHKMKITLNRPYSMN